MSKDEDQSLGDQHTFDGGAKDTGPESLGDEKTFSGGARQTAPKSLGDEITMGGGGSTDDTLFDDDMEVVDLSARYTTEGVLGKGGMGEVLLATDTRLERKVAIKQPRVTKNPGPHQSTDETRRVNTWMSESAVCVQRR